MAARAPRGKALVLGQDERSFLSVVRSLGRHGVEVHVAWCPATAPAARSRHIARLHELPWPSLSAGATWEDEFERLLERERFDLVVPTNDPAMIPLQRNRARFEPLSRLAIPPDRAFEVAFDKIKTHELASSLGIPVARGAVIRRPEELDPVLAQLTYPAVVKPRASFLPEDLEERGFVRRCRDAAAVRDAVDDLLLRGDVLIEQSAHGPGHGYELLAERGEILMRFQHERLHEPPHGGWSTYRRSTRIDPRFEDAARQLVSALDHTGIAMVEFKGDPATGRWILVEINARFWGSLPLALSAGVDFPAALWDLLVEGTRPPPARYQVDVYARNLSSDVKWMWHNARADKSDPALTTRSLGSIVAEARHLVRGRERSDTFVADDLPPAWAELRALAVESAGRLLAPAAALRHSLPWVRRRRARARRALDEARSVLFVCRGNICRSPFAAHVAEARYGGAKRIRSAGLVPLAERPSPLVARIVAREHGVDLERHRSAAITPETLAEADVVLVFDEANRRELLRRFPEVRSRVWLVGELGGGAPAIADPLNRGRAAYRDAYRRIAELLDGVGARSPNGPRREGAVRDALA
jgi:protein-tyrosine-phosphatase/predicted ATP-grasp superfamily ATP-dependent carboligase